METQWTAGYVRISKEEKKKEPKEESGSIQNQKRLIEQEFNRKAKQEQCGGELIFYEDDGVSGRHFNRPGFQRMMRDVEQGKIDAIYVKDLSRLGRDYVETGQLLDYFSLKAHVQVILLNHNPRFEQSAANRMNQALENIRNDFYSRDVSRKIKRVMEEKKARQEFTGGRPPYGYCWQKGAIQIKETEQRIIEDIFSLYLEGMSAVEVAERLNGREICAPFKQSKWCADSVLRILRNQSYTGTRKGYPKIVEETLFQAAEKRRKNVEVKNKTGKNADYPLTGLAKCKICHHNLTRQQKAEGTCYCCRYGRAYGHAKVEVREAELRETLARILNGYVKHVGSYEKMQMQQRKYQKLSDRRKKMQKEQCYRQWRNEMLNKKQSMRTQRERNVWEEKKAESNWWMKELLNQIFIDEEGSLWIQWNFQKTHTDREEPMV